MAPTKKKSNATKTNLIVDIGLFTSFLIAMAPEATGLLIHEWLGIAFGAAIVGHLLLHWKWLVQVTRRFFGKLPPQTRGNYILNTLLFVDVIFVILSGLMISQVATPSLGQGNAGIWYGLHETSANLSMLLVAGHLALHWKWILNAIKRYAIKPVISIGQVRKPQAVPVLVERRTDQ